MSKEDQTALIASDKGLTLINDLINAKDADGNDYVFEYVAGSSFEYVNEAGRTITNSGGTVSLSITPKDINGGDHIKDINPPPPGVSGIVRIPQGKTYDLGDRNKEIRRSSITYHELRENYLRTVDKLPYRKANSDPAYSRNPSLGYYKGYEGAHNRSVEMEGGNYGNPNPGGYSHID